jgi:uncharacterized membrane protein (DUF2068 family)
LKIGHKSIALLKVFRGSLALMISISLWEIVLAEEFQDIKVQLQTLSQNLDEPVINIIVGYLLQANDQHLVLLALFFTLLSAVRFTEAIGLWTIKKWAEVITLLSSLIYIPFELIALFEELNIVISTILMINIFISTYLFLALRRRNKNTEIKPALLQQ